MGKPGVSRLSAMHSPSSSGNGSNNKFKSFKKSLLSFVRSPTLSPKEKTKKRRSFPTPATATSECPTPVTTTSTSTRKQPRLSKTKKDIPPPPFVDPSVASPDVSEIHDGHPLEASERQRVHRKQRIFQNGKLLYEWEQNSTHATIRLPQSWTSNSYAQEASSSTDLKVLIAPSFLQVGIIHKKRGQKPRLEWKLHHTTGGTIHVPGSTWTTPEEHQMPDQGTIITLAKAKAGVHWAYGLLHNPRERIQVKLCRPPRTKQRRPKKKVSISKEEVIPPPMQHMDETPKTPSQRRKKVKKKKKVSTTTTSPSPNPKKKKRISSIRQESTYFQEKQKSGRKSDSFRDSFRVSPPLDTEEEEEPNNNSSSSSRLNSSSTRTHTTKPTSFSSRSGHPSSPRRSGGEYSMTPTSNNRLKVSREEAAGSIKNLNLYEDQEAERRSIADLEGSKRGFIHVVKQSSGRLDISSPKPSPKRFSKPTSRISMEIKSPKPTLRTSMEIKSPKSPKSPGNNSSHRSSFKSFGSGLGSSGGGGGGNKPSRVSMQFQNKRKSEGTTILVPSKASVMQKGETKRASHSNMESLDFVGHGYSHDMDAARHHKRTTLNAYLEKPNVPSNASDSQFKSINSANTSKAVVQSTLQGWTASHRTNSSHARRRSRSVKVQEEDHHHHHHDEEDGFMHELEMSYSRMSTLL